MKLPTTLDRLISAPIIDTAIDTAMNTAMDTAMDTSAQGIHHPAIKH